MSNDRPGYVLDSFALLALFQSEPGADAVAQLLRDAEAGRIQLMMTVANLGEVVYRTIREHGPDQADRVLARINEMAIDMIDVDRDLALAAATLKGSYRMAYADCMAAALAQQLDAPIVTGDPDFRQVEDLVAVEWLLEAERG